MRSFWSEPFLWIHFAGIGAFPIFLALVWLGLGVRTPVLPSVAEILLLATLGIIPVLWMQLSRPFYIFSVLVVAIEPMALNLQQRRLLSQFKTQGNRLLAIIIAVFSLWVLWQIYNIAPLAASMVTIPTQWRPAGLVLAVLAFLASNLFLQVSLSVLRVLTTSESEWAVIEPYPIEQIQQDFTIPGKQIKLVLPQETPAATKGD